MSDVLETVVDEQDLAEVFDEDNTNTEDQRLGGAEDGEQVEDLVDLFDVTKAVGDADDDDALIGEDLDDAQIVDLAQDEDDDEEDEDEEDEMDEDALRGPEPDDEDDDDLIESLDEEDEDIVDGVDLSPSADVDLAFVGDMNDVAGAHSAAQRFESKSLSDQDLVELDYKED